MNLMIPASGEIDHRSLPKIILSANTDWYLYNFRLALAREIVKRGASLLLVSPPGPYAQRILAEGLRWQPLKIARRSINPLVDFLVLLRFITLYCHEKPDLVHHFTIKPIIYGSLAARILGVPAVVNSVTGLGYLFVNPSNLATALQVLIRPIYRTALSGINSRVIFQNASDQKLFIREHLVKVENTVLISGSGVNADVYKPSPEPNTEPMILMASRMLWDKGVREIVEAARILQKKGFIARFVLVGDSDRGNPAAVSEDQLQAWHEEGIIEWWGHRDDMPEVMAQSHIVVLPSYGEGLPRVLLEAGAAGKPVVTTDVPGCRDIIQDGVNGILVPPKDPLALTEAISRLVIDTKLRMQMGAAGRSLVVRGYTTDHINQKTFEVYRELVDSKL